MHFYPILLIVLISLLYRNSNSTVKLHQKNDFFNGKENQKSKIFTFGLQRQTEQNASYISLKSNQYQFSYAFLDLKYPDGYGHVTIYIRGSCRKDRRYSFQSFSILYARYDEERLKFSRHWIRYSPTMPMYTDRKSRQTIVFARSGTFILQAIENRSNRIFSLGQLLSYGYASFKKDCSRMSNYFRFERYIKPDDGQSTDLLNFDPRRGGFLRNIATKIESDFEPRCYSLYDRFYDGYDEEYDYASSSEDLSKGFTRSPSLSISATP